MNKTIFALALAVTALVAGCGDPVDQRPSNSIPIPKDSDTATHIPQTKEEKIAAINKAPISDEQKKKAIAEVEAGSK